MENFYERVKSNPIIPVIKIEDAEKAPLLAQALLDGGISVIEITYRTACAGEAIRLIHQKFPQMYICAGTILNEEQAKDAVEAGAHVIVSPGTNEKVVSYCLENHIPVIPGVATPTEVETCLQYGLKVLKLFPAEVVGGIKMLKALAEPYSDLKFMPTGGINPQNLSAYLSLPNVIACGGSWIAPDSLIQEGKFQEITALAQSALNAAFDRKN